MCFVDGNAHKQTEGLRLLDFHMETPRSTWRLVGRHRATTVTGPFFCKIRALLQIRGRKQAPREAQDFRPLFTYYLVLKMGQKVSQNRRLVEHAMNLGWT